MFDIGGPEIILIVLGIIVLFGPKKIPEIAQMIGRGIQKVRDAQSQFKDQMDEIQSELNQVKNPDFTKVVPKNDPKSKINEVNPQNLRRDQISFADQITDQNDSKNAESENIEVNNKKKVDDNLSENDTKSTSTQKKESLK